MIQQQQQLWTVSLVLPFQAKTQLIVTQQQLQLRVGGAVAVVVVVVDAEGVVVVAEGAVVVAAVGVIVIIVIVGIVIIVIVGIVIVSQQPKTMFGVSTEPTTYISDLEQQAAGRGYLEA
jgi:hypothetical protein